MRQAARYVSRCWLEAGSLEPAYGAVEPWLECDRYEALTPWIASYLAGLISRDSYSGHVEQGPAQLPRVSGGDGFDRLWAFDSSEVDDHEIVAQKGNLVFYIFYSGTKDTREIISIVKAKMKAN